VERYEILVLSAYQVRAVDRKEGLPFPDELVGLIDEDLPNPPGKAGLHITLKSFVWLDQPRCIDSANQVFFLHCGDLETDQLSAFGG
jgi:hypothetical protein